MKRFCSTISCVSMVGALVAILLFVHTPLAHATSVMTIVPDKTQVGVNELVGANIFINTGGANINNAEGVITFPATQLTVESVSTAGSIFSIWVEQPTYSNATGRISFNGGVPNPGFNGAQGLVIRVQFRAKSAGAALLGIASAGIYANDGLGTNVTSAAQAAQGLATIQIGPATQTQPPVTPGEPFPTIPPPVTLIDVPEPVVTSSLVDPDAWYSTTTALFSWAVPRGVTSVQLLHGLRPESTPTVLYTPAINRRLLTKLEDGVQYFHIRFRSGTTWGETVHRKFQIDTTAPSIDTINSRLTSEDRIEITLEATDTPSGVARYEAYAGDTRIAEASNQQFLLEPLATGGHNITLRAYDRAGNYTEKNVGVVIPELRAPRFTTYPSTIGRGELFTVDGVSYADTNIRIGMSVDGGDVEYATTRSRADGTFSWEGRSLASGTTMSLWAEAVRTPTVISPSSEKIRIDIKTNLFEKFGTTAIDILSLAIPITLILLALIMVTIIGVHKIRLAHHKHAHRLTGSSLDSHKVFSVIKEDVARALDLYEKNSARRKRTPEEDETIRVLKTDLEEAEKYFTERLKK